MSIDDEVFSELLDIAFRGTNPLQKKHTKENEKWNECLKVLRKNQQEFLVSLRKWYAKN